MRRKNKFIWPIIYLCLITLQAQTPTEVVEKVANKIIRETTFELYSKAQQKADGLQIVNLPETNSNNPLFAKSIIHSDEDVNAVFGISSTQPIEVWINGKSIFVGSNLLGNFSTVAYDMYKFPKEFKAELKEGNNVILVKTSSNKNDFFALAAIKEHGMLNGKVKFIIPITDEQQSKYHKWILLGPVDENYTEQIVKKSIKEYVVINDKFFTWYLPETNIVLDDVVENDFPFHWHSYFEWHYANGQMLLGMQALADLTSDQKYLNHIKKFCDFTLDNFDYFKYQYEVLNERSGFNHRLYRRKMMDDTGGPALPFIELNLRGELDNARSLIDTIAAYISEGQSRLPDGTLCRPEPREWTVWADDLFMAVPFLLRYAELTGEDKYYDDAANQIVLFYAKLFDPEENLYYHGWFSDTKEHSVAHWGRANGWVMWAVSEALLYLPKDHPKYNEILNIYKKHVNGLVNYQDENGIWHQVIDKPESYEETSSSAMFTLGIARGVLNGWLNESYKDPAIKGWNAITKNIDEDGTVNGICRGTGMGFDLDFYYKRDTRPHDPRGLGGVLTAGVEVAKLFKENRK